jgi:hypothetical protein
MMGATWLLHDGGLAASAAGDEWHELGFMAEFDMSGHTAERSGGLSLSCGTAG